MAEVKIRLRKSLKLMFTCKFGDIKEKEKSKEIEWGEPVSKDK